MQLTQGVNMKRYAFRNDDGKEIMDEGEKDIKRAIDGTRIREI